MRNKQKVYQNPSVRIQPMPKAVVTPVTISNLHEQKERFLKQGKTPVFVVEGDTSMVDELAAKTSGKIRFDLLGEAEYILRTIKQQFRTGENYLEQTYGPRIEQDEANKILLDYITENNLQESLTVYWSNEMTCSARMAWKGYSFKCNRPEARKYSLWLNGTDENPYLRRYGLRCLLDHEIGTHFYRSYNDGFQPWFYDRKKFGLRGAGSFEGLCSEEGLAAINTTLRAKEKYLWLSALVYYTACKSTEMNFKQLFDHLGQFVHNPEQRWKHVMRVKRGLIDTNDLGGYGKDQCYFEGAVAILRNIDNIDFHLLMSGKICYDEVSRVKRMARLGSVCLPAIMQDMESYRKQLKKIAVLNGLHLEHPSYGPSQSYLERLKERQAGIRKRKKVRKRKKMRASVAKVSSGSVNSKSSGQSQNTVPLKSGQPPAGFSCPEQKDFMLCDRELSSDTKDSSSDTKSSDFDTVEDQSNSVLEENTLSQKSAEASMRVGAVNSATDSTGCLEDRSHSPSSSLRSLEKVPETKTAEKSPCLKTASQVSCPISDSFSTQVFPSGSDTNISERNPQSSAHCRASSKIPVKSKKRLKSSTSEPGKLKLAPLIMNSTEKLDTITLSGRSSAGCKSKTTSDISESAVIVEMAGSTSISSSSGSKLSPKEDIKSWLLSLPSFFPAVSPSMQKVSDISPLPPINDPEQIGDSRTAHCVYVQTRSKPTVCSAAEPCSSQAAQEDTSSKASPSHKHQ